MQSPQEPSEFQQSLESMRESIDEVSSAAKELRQSLEVSQQEERSFRRIQTWGIIAEAVVIVFILVQTIQLGRQTSAMNKQTDEMIKQTTEALEARKVMLLQVEEMKRQTDAALRSQEAMIEQVEQMKLQTRAVVDANIPILAFTPTTSKDFLEHTDGTLVFYINIENSGSRTAFETTLLHTSSIPKNELTPTRGLGELAPGKSLSVPLSYRRPLPVEFTVNLTLTWRRGETIEEPYISQPYRRERIIEVTRVKSDTLWHAYIVPPGSP